MGLASHSSSSHHQSLEDPLGQSSMLLGLHFLCEAVMGRLPPCCCDVMARRSNDVMARRSNWSKHPHLCNCLSVQKSREVHLMHTRYHNHLSFPSTLHYKYYSFGAREASHTPSRLRTRLQSYVRKKNYHLQYLHHLRVFA